MWRDKQQVRQRVRKRQGVTLICFTCHERQLPLSSINTTRHWTRLTVGIYRMHLGSSPSPSPSPLCNYEYNGKCQMHSRCAVNAQPLANVIGSSCYYYYRTDALTLLCLRLFQLNLHLFIRQTIGV